MKTRLLVFLLITLVALPLIAAPPDKRDVRQSMAAVVDNDTYINVNRILMFVTNHGNFCRDLVGVFGQDAGTFFPYVNIESIENGSLDDYCLYASGLWVGALVNGETRVIIAEYSDEYVPGPMQNGTFMTDRPEFRVYKLYKDSLATNPNQDYLDWPADQGAPVNPDGTPRMIGDQMLWAVYNDADSSGHDNDAGSTDPLGLEVRQTTFAFDRQGALGHIIFVRLEIFNKGGNTLDSCYLSLWSDPDVGDHTDDLVGCDTLLDLGFVYNGDNNDAGHYVRRAPSVGYDFFQGPLQYTGDMADTAKMWNFQRWPGYRNMGLYSFNKYINGTDPNDFNETYNYMRGLNANGTPYVYEGDTLLFVHSGDPVRRTGDRDVNPADRRWMQTTGPITFAPGDSTEIIAGIVVGQGADRLSSISVMKYYDQSAQTAYDIDFDIPEPPYPPQVTQTNLDGGITLTWTDTSETDPGDYPFQGYTVYQGESAAGPWTRVANFDVIDGIAGIQDWDVNANTGVLEYVGVKFGEDGGLLRYWNTREDYILGGPLRNVTTYYYKVEAYSYDPDAVPNTLTSSSRIIAAQPQTRILDEVVPTEPNSDIDVTHIGPSGGVATITIVDPAALTGNSYRIFFEDSSFFLIDSVDSAGTPWDTVYVIYDIDSSGTPWDTTYAADTVQLWSMRNTTTGQLLLARQPDQTGNTDQLVTEGFVASITGPAAGFESFQVVANGAGVVDPPEAGAFPWAGFPTPTGVDPDGYPTDGQQVGPALWGIHTADNGGSGAGGTRGDFEAFLSRATRDGAQNAAINSWDFEIRFTGSNDNPGVNGSYAIEWYNDDNVFWVPFELWNVGLGTLDNTSDDIRMIPFVIDDGDDNIFALESWGDTLLGGGDLEHSVSGALNDPFTDWIYLFNPANMTAGEAGYDAAEAEMLAGTFPTNAGNLVGDEVLSRVVFVSWNGDTAHTDATTGRFNQDCPEQGTIFRITTAKPNSTADTFTFTTSPIYSVASKGEGLLDDIKVVPNPFYMYGPYDPAPGNYQIKFTHLPAKCTITIYNLAGDFIRRIEKDDATTSIATWSVNTDNNLPVASGIYLYVVDAPGFGTKIGKFAVFTETELIDVY